MKYFALTFHSISAVCTTLLISSCSLQKPAQNDKNTNAFNSNAEKPKGEILELSAAEEKSLGSVERNSKNPQNPQIVSEQTKALLEKNYSENELKNLSGDNFLDTYKIRTRASLLYFLDAPAHKEAVLNWLAEANAEVQFHNEKLGYIDALVDWKSLKELADSFGKFGLNEASVFKLEVEDFEAAKIAKEMKALKSGVREKNENSSYFGPSHSAGYSAKVEEFLETASKKLNVKPEELQGQGIKVAVYDGGIDMSRTDVFGKRITDFVVGDERNWKKGSWTLEEFEATNLAEFELGLPKGLKKHSSKNADLENVKFGTLSEVEFDFDFNRNGSKNETDVLFAIVPIAKNLAEVHLQVAKSVGFGKPLKDLKIASLQNKPQLLNLETGFYFERNELQPSFAATAIKIREKHTGEFEVAWVGLPNSSEHGIANLHMVGGNLTLGSAGNINKVSYKGVAPSVEFIGANTWQAEGTDYGTSWFALARTMIGAVDAGADILDLDIYTPGSAVGNDLLSSLACRIVQRSYVVPLAAAHNFGPFEQTVQSLAQSPCVLGIGASHSAAGMRARNRGSVNPNLADSDVETANYSGRGFGLNGQFKPDIVSPAYGLTAYGKNLIRFAGTSGATPTTAGVIALLKQVGKKFNTELGYEQIKYYLQAGSTPVAAGKERDGFGYTNLEKSFELLLADLESNNVPSRISISGHKPFHFSGKPNTTHLEVNLERVALSQKIGGAENTPEPMEFWIEYGGNSIKTENWLQFYSKQTGTTSNTITTDIAPFGEVQNLRLFLNLSDEKWNELKTGDHIAVVKGLRKSLFDKQNMQKNLNKNTNSRVAIPADFILPVSFLKGANVTSSSLTVKPQFIDEIQRFYLNANIGDYFLISGNAKCDGKNVSGKQEALEIIVDNFESYPHASYKDNGYNNFELSLNPLQIVAQKNIVAISVFRDGQGNCNGALGGSFNVRKIGFETKNTEVTFERSQNSTVLRTNLVLTGDGLNQAESRKSNIWNFEAQNPELQMRYTTTQKQFKFVVPSGSKRVYLKLSGKAQATLLERNKNTTSENFGDVEQFSVSNHAEYGGFSGASKGTSFNETKFDTVMKLENLTQGNEIEIANPFEEKIDVILSVNPSEASSDSAVNFSFQKDIAAWKQGEEKTLSVSVLPSSLPQNLIKFAGNSNKPWNLFWIVPVVLQESHAESNPDATILPVVLWKTEFSIPVFL